MFERRGESRKIYTSNWVLQISGLDYFHNNDIDRTIACHGNHEFRAIRENTDATILIRTTLAVASYDCGYLVLRGLPGQTETARTLFEDIIIQGYGYRNVPIRLRALDAAHVGHNIVNVPIRQTMRLFGKNDLRIKDVEYRTGAWIKVLPISGVHNQMDGHMRKVVMYGTQEELEMAINALMNDQVDQAMQGDSDIDNP